MISKKKEFEVLSVKEKVSQRKIERLETMKSEQEQQKEEIKSQLSGSTNRVKELEEQIKKLKDSVEPLKQAKEKSDSQIVRLSVDLKKKVDEIKELYKQIKKLEFSLKRKERKQSTTPKEGENVETQENQEDVDIENEIEKEDIMEDISQDNPISVIGNQENKTEDNNIQDNVSASNKVEQDLAKDQEQIKDNIIDKITDKENSPKKIFEESEGTKTPIKRENVVTETQDQLINEIYEKEGIQDDKNPLKIMKKNIISRNGTNEKESENNLKDKAKQGEKAVLISEKEGTKDSKKGIETSNDQVKKFTI